MQNKKSLKINFFLNLIGQLVTLLVPIITTPYLARILHEEGIGIFSYSSSIITYFILIANLGFETYAQREIAKTQLDPKHQTKTFWELIILRSVTTIVSLVCLFICLGLEAFGSKYNFIIMMLSLNVVAIMFDLSFFYRGIEDFKNVAIRTILIKVLATAGIFLFVKDSNDVWIYALCTSASTLIAACMTWIGIKKHLTSIHGRHLEFKKHFLPLFILFIPTLSITIYTVSDKTMLGLLSKNPDYDNGCYDQAYKINSLALTPFNVLISVIIPRNSHDYYSGEIDAFKKHIYWMCNVVWMLGLPMIVGFFVLSNNFSSWFFGNGYEIVPTLLIIMSFRMIISGLGSVFGNLLFTPMGKEIYPLIATIIGAVVNISLNVILIPIYGATGAAITTLLCETTVTFILAILVMKNKTVSLVNIFKMSFKYIIASILMFGLIYFMQTKLAYSIWSTFLIAFSGCVLYFLILIIIRDKFVLDYSKRGLQLIKKIIRK